MCGGIRFVELSSDSLPDVNRTKSSPLLGFVLSNVSLACPAKGSTVDVPKGEDEMLRERAVVGDD